MGKSLVRNYESQKAKEPAQIYSIHNGLAKMMLWPNVYSERAIIYDAFEPHITKLFLSIVKKGDIFFEIGCWIGYYSVLAAAKGAAQIVAIDIEERNVKRTKENLSLNAANATVLHIGVSNRTGRATVNTDASYNMRSMKQDDGTNTVSTDTLDRIADSQHIERIDLAMMDIEGHEVYALEGLTGLLAHRAIRNLIIEVHPPRMDRDPTSMEKMLERYGYTVEKIIGHQPDVYHLHAIAP